MKRNGFTIIEVLVAVMILSTDMVILSSSWSGSLAMNRKGSGMTTISYLLKRAIVEVEIKYGGSHPKEPNVPEGPEEHEFEGDEYKDYSWRLESKKMEF